MMTKKRVAQSDILRFRKTIWRYYRVHKRKMPWRNTHNPYRILISEIMLQQTHVDRVREKYAQFLRAFPGFAALARAPFRNVLRAWRGLGYNRRALYVHTIAQRVVREHRGKLPRDPDTLADFPGIGAATAASICAFAFNTPVAFIETNIRRVFIHFFFARARRVADSDILPLIARALDMHNPREWYFALMDYGAYLAGFVDNPNKKSAHYAKQKKFTGSDRELRGIVVSLAATRAFVTERDVAARTHEPVTRVRRIASGLVRDGLLRKTRKGFRIV